MRFYGERGREEEGREAQGGRTRVTKRIERIRRGRTLPKWVIRDAVCFQSPAESFMPAIIPGYAWRTGRREGGREGEREGGRGGAIIEIVFDRLEPIQEATREIGEEGSGREDSRVTGF